MNEIVLRLYHRMPASVRNVIASARGYQLRHWRYGRETERIARETLEREYWSPEQWDRWHQEQLAELLRMAATEVPYYRDHWARRRRAGDRSSCEVLENWPVLEKDEVRDNPERFLRDGVRGQRLQQEQTSGTTGKPLRLWSSRETARKWYGICEARWRYWYGLSRHDRWGILGGQLVVPVHQNQPPFWVWNAGLNQLYLSSYHLAPDFIAHYIDALRRWKVRYLVGYTSALFTLAWEILRRGDDLPLNTIITNAEPVSERQRRTIEKAFQCPLRETYGMSEMVSAAGECAHGSLHLWPDAGILEVMDGDRVLPRGEVGDLVCTGLVNREMPLIRYRLGDRGALAAGTEPCRCGRSLPRLASIEGRMDEVLYTPDGRAIGRMDPVFKGDLPLREAQIIQESLMRVRLVYVPAPGFQESHRETLINRIRDRMGPVEVELEATTHVPRAAGGKFRAVLCRLSPEERRRCGAAPELG